MLTLIQVVGIILFVYLTWRNLFDNYRDDKLISYSWMVLLAMLAAGRITYGIVNWGELNDSIFSWFRLVDKPGFNYAGGIVGFLVFTMWYGQASSWKVWPFLEDVTPQWLLLLMFLAGGEMIRSGFEIRSVYTLVVLALGLISARVIYGKYRSFVWYKSGKKGFGFFFVMMILMFMMMIVSLIYKDVIYVPVLYFAGSLISLLGLFILGEVFDNLLVFRRRK